MADGRSTNSTIQTKSGFIWSIAEILRGDFKQSEYGKVILPFVVLRRLDCLLEPSKAAVLKTAETLPADIDDTTRDMILFSDVGNKGKMGTVRPGKAACSSG